MQQSSNMAHLNGGIVLNVAVLCINFKLEGRS